MPFRSCNGVLEAEEGRTLPTRRRGFSYGDRCPRSLTSRRSRAESTAGVASCSAADCACVFPCTIAVPRPAATVDSTVRRVIPFLAEGVLGGVFWFDFLDMAAPEIVEKSAAILSPGWNYRGVVYT